MKLAIFSTSLIIILLIVLPVILTFGLKYLPGGVQPSLGNTKRIYESFTFSQSFVSPADNLSGIGTSIKNPNFANKKDLTLNIHDDRGEPIRTLTVNGKNIEDGKFVKLTFPLIEKSKDQRFTFSLSSPQSVYENALEIFLTERKPSWSLEFKVNDQLVDENLSYITLHKVLSPLEVLSIVYTNWLRKLLGDPYFLAIYIILLSSTLLIVVSPLSKGTHRV